MNLRSQSIEPLRNALGRQPSATAGRRAIAAAAGVSLTLAVLLSVYHTARRVYYDYYFYPRVKEEYIKPDGRTRLLDAIYVAGVILLLYLAYRLLKYALRDRSAGTI